MITARPATEEDTATWRALRRDGIERYPSVFIPTLAEHDATPDTDDSKRLAAGGRFLAFDGETPVGLCGINRHTMPRANHRAELGPFYVIPAAQGKGAAKSLIDAAFAYAREQGIWQIELDVNEDNARAIRFYQHLGFHQVGRIPNALMGADGPEHDLIFILYLPPA